jgi:periplasmic protein TonB
MTNFRRWLRIGCLSLAIGTAPLCHAQTDDVGEWLRHISIQLASQKRFPLEARGQSGTAKVAFTIDRSGNLVSDQLLESTGFPVLDAEALAMVHRAQPFPPPPAQAGDDKLKFVLPVVFARRAAIDISKEDIRKDDAIMKGEEAVTAKLRGICRGC